MKVGVAANVVFDPIADGKTAFKASYSRYGLQVGIDRVLNVNPLQSDFQLCTWTDPNSDGVVLSESPPGGTQLKPGTTVNLNVGRLSSATTTATTPSP